MSAEQPFIKEHLATLKGTIDKGIDGFRRHSRAAYEELHLTDAITFVRVRNRHCMNVDGNQLRPYTRRFQKSDRHGGLYKIELDGPPKDRLVFSGILSLQEATRSSSEITIDMTTSEQLLGEFVAGMALAVEEALASGDDWLS